MTAAETAGCICENVSLAVRHTTLLPANRGLAIGEVELRDSFRREERLKEVLQTLHYDYVILDCPPNLGLLVVNALVAANLVIVPVSTPLAYRGTSDLFEIMSELKSAFNASWDIRALQTFYRQGVLESETLRERLAGDFGEKLFDSRINLNTDISVATSSGRPLLEFTRSSGYLDYRRLAEEVLHVTEGYQAERDSRPAASSGSHR